LTSASLSSLPKVFYEYGLLYWSFYHKVDLQKIKTVNIKGKMVKEIKQKKTSLDVIKKIKNLHYLQNYQFISSATFFKKSP